MIRIAKSLLATLMLVPPAYGDNCHVRRQVVVQEQVVAVPFVVPVGVVIPGSPLYSYRDAAQAYSGNVRTSDAQLFEEFEQFKAWRSKQHPKVQANQATPAATVFSSRCASCHSGDGAKGSFEISKATSEQLRKAIERVADGSMPPKEKPRLTAEENGKVIHELATMKAADAVTIQAEAPKEE